MNLDCFQLWKVPSEFQLADLFTKPFSRGEMGRLMKLLRIQEVHAGKKGGVECEPEIPVGLPWPVAVRIVQGLAVQC